jgi:ribosomal protein S18 acetylase RimI-like enzyme
MEIKDGSQYLEDVKILIIDYINTLQRDLSFQNLDAELANLKTKYTPPYGKVLVAVVDEKVVGCVAYHRHNNKRCEMKRLYVMPAYRGLRIGQKLVEEIMEIAKQDGYTEMVLDTIEPLYCAISLYKKCGFKERKAYYDNPMEDVIYMQCCLS